MAQAKSLLLEGFPSGRKIEFHVHSGAESKALMTGIQQSKPKAGAETLWYEHAMALPRYVIDSDNDQPPALEYEDRYSNWPPPDIEFYETVYRELTQLTDEERTKAQEAAKSLRNRP